MYNFLNTNNFAKDGVQGGTDCIYKIGSILQEQIQKNIKKYWAGIFLTMKAFHFCIFQSSNAVLEPT